MGHACTPDDFPRSPPPNGEHPVIAAIALLAILAAILLIAWATVAVHGTEELAGFLEDGAAGSSAMSNSAQDAAASSRWATGFSH